MNVRVGGRKFIHNRVRGGNTACGISKGHGNMFFLASGESTCPACAVRPLMDNPHKALNMAMSLPVQKGKRDNARTSILAEAIHNVISA